MHFKKAIGQNIFWRGLYLASTFAINVLVSRLLTADKSGNVFYIINNLAFLILITSFSLESGTAYYLAKKQIAAFKVAIFSILYSLLAALVCTVIFHLIFENDKVTIVFFYVFGTMLVSFFNGLFAALQNFKLPNIILLCSNILLIVCIMLFWDKSFLKQQFYNFYFGVFALQGFFLAVAFLLNYSTKEGKKIRSSKIFSLIFKYSLLAISANVIYFLLYRVDYWFVKHFCSASALGNYIQASKLGQIFLSIPSIIGASVFAMVAAATNGNAATAVLRVSRTVFVIAFVFMIVLICFGNWLFPFLFGNSFNNMYMAFVLLAPGTLAICFLYPLTAYFAGIKMIRVNIIGSTLALLLVILGDCLLIPKYGIMAAAAISSVGYATYAFYVIGYFCRQNNIAFTSIFEIKKFDTSWFVKGKNENIEQ